MAKKELQHSCTTYTITSQDGSTSMTLLPERGGFGSSLIMPTANGPREMLFLHDFFWEKEWTRFPGGWPFLFPVCARSMRDGTKGDYLYNGKRYNLDIHGFAWHSPWDVIDETDDSLTIRLKSSEHTLKMYPFHFEVTLRYHVKNSAVFCHQTYTNCGDARMPYYAGFHPYLRMPEAGPGKDAVQLDFKPTRRFKYNAALTDLVGEQPLFQLPTSITNPEILEQLTYLSDDKEVRLTLPDGIVIHIDATGVEDPTLFSYLQLYTIAEKPFFCAEHWMSFPNAINTIDGVRWLEAGESDEGLYKLWI